MYRAGKRIIIIYTAAITLQCRIFFLFTRRSRPFYVVLIQVAVNRRTYVSL